MEKVTFKVGDIVIWTCPDNNIIEVYLVCNIIECNMHKKIYKLMLLYQTDNYFGKIYSQYNFDEQEMQFTEFKILCENFK